MTKSPRRDPYPSPFVSVFELGGDLYVITERRGAKLTAVKLNAAMRKWAQSELDDAHANLDALLLGFHRKLRRRAPR